VAEGFTAAEDFTGEGSTAAISADIATLSEVTTAGMAVATAITGTEAVGMVALTTVADIGMEARIGGVTHSVSGTMTTITNRIRPTTPMTGVTHFG
jgi:hydroxymethylpyrimidine/phosphomethylpyrimidine kinase